MPQNKRSTTGRCSGWTFTADPSVRDQRLNDLLREVHQRYVDLALIVVSGLLLAFASGYIVGVKARCPTEVGMTRRVQ